MPTAYLLIREGPHYRRNAFSAGLAACGYRVEFNAPRTFQRDDLVVTWNRYFQWHNIATEAERCGARVLVAENGYIGGPKDGGTNYAIALHAHNGMGKWPSGDDSRLRALGVELKPWRAKGNHILLAPNRAFGQPGLAMPPEWPREVRHELQRRAGGRQIVYRDHPGNGAEKVPLARDLENCHLVVVWASTVGVKALIAGVPVVCCSPHWICKGAAGTLDDLQNPPTSDDARYAALSRLAWGQWNLSEISSGLAFRNLLDMR